VADAGAVIDARIAAWRPLAEQRGVTLERSGVASQAVLVVPGTLDQAMDALIDNALKFAGAGAAVTVHLDRHRRDGIVEVHVSDTGPGLSAEERRRATERFWRAPAHQNIDGSGLGLAIVAVLAETSGGRLDLLEGELGGLDARLCLRAATSLALNGDPDQDQGQCQEQEQQAVRSSPAGSTAPLQDAAGPGRSRSPRGG